MIAYTDKRRVPFQIDAEDFEAVSRYVWHLQSSGYPATNIGKRPTYCRVLLLHLFLFGRAPLGLEWDHINRDKLDNRRSNLRAVTRTTNLRNSGVQRNNLNGHLGISYIGGQRSRHWWARIMVNREAISLGYYATAEEAVAARARAEEELWHGRT